MAAIVQADATPATSAPWVVEARLEVDRGVLVGHFRGLPEPTTPAVIGWPPASWALRQAAEIRYGPDVTCRSEPCTREATWSVGRDASGTAWSFVVPIDDRSGNPGRRDDAWLLAGTMPGRVLPAASGDPTWEPVASWQQPVHAMLDLPESFEPVTGGEAVPGPLLEGRRVWKVTGGHGGGALGLVRPVGLWREVMVGDTRLRVAAPSGEVRRAEAVLARATPMVRWLSTRYGPPPGGTLTLAWTGVTTLAREIVAPGLVILPAVMLAQEDLLGGLGSLSGLEFVVARGLARQWFPPGQQDGGSPWLDETLPQWVAGGWLRETRPGGRVARAWLDPAWAWLDPLRVLTAGLPEEEADAVAYQEAMGEEAPLARLDVADRMARPRLWTSRGPRVLEEFRTRLPSGAFASWIAAVRTDMVRGLATTESALAHAAVADACAAAWLKAQVLGAGEAHGQGASPPRLSAPAVGWHADVGGVFRPQPWFFGLGAYPWAATWASRNDTFIGDLRMNFIGGHPPGEGLVPYVRPGIRALVERGVARGVPRIDGGVAWVPEPELGVRPRGVLFRAGAEGLPGQPESAVADAEVVWHRELGWRRRLSLRAWTGVATDQGRSMLDLGHEGLTQWDPVGAVRWGTTVGAEGVMPLGGTWQLPWLPFEGWTLGTAFLNQAWYGRPLASGEAAGTLTETGLGVVIGLPGLGFPSILGVFVPIWTQPQGGAFVPVLRAGSAFRF